MDQYDKLRQDLTVKLAEALEKNEQLQAEAEEYHNQYHLCEAKLLSHKSIIKQGQKAYEQLLAKVSRLEGILTSSKDMLEEVQSIYGSGFSSLKQRCLCTRIREFIDSNQDLKLDALVEQLRIENKRLEARIKQLEQLLTTPEKKEE